MRIAWIIVFVMVLSSRGHGQVTNLHPAYGYREFFESSARAMAERQGITNAYEIWLRTLTTKGFTNLTEADLRKDPAFLTNLFRIHASLPWSCLDWPPPDTNRMGGVMQFIDRHGWNMPARSASEVMRGQGTKPITGLPWPVIAESTFPAYTSDGWLFVILHGPTSFGPEHDGLVWSPHTNHPPLLSHTWKPLGGGWYAFVYPKKEAP